MFVEEPTPWVLLDIDGAEFEPDWRGRLVETAARLRLRLPDAFADASCWFQATASAADPTKPDLGGAAVRMRLAFVLDRPLTQGQLEAWFTGVRGVDPSTFRTVQEIYVGRPVFEGGLRDPMPVRSGVLEGLEDVVRVPDDLPDRPPAAERRSSVPPAGSLGGADGTGLLDCPAFEAALARIGGGAGSVRTGLGRAAAAYIRRVGPERVDVGALAARLAEEGLRHRGEADVAGYGLPDLVRWHLARAPEGAAAADESEAAPGPEPEALPDFGPVRPDRDAALAELRAEIEGAIGSAGRRIGLRRELKERQREAAAAAGRALYDELTRDD
jgi:hypothetical protein